MSASHHATARALLARYHQSMLDKDADLLASCYAADGVHEFPLLSPFFPQRLLGREAIARHYGAVWGRSPIRILEIREIAVHDTQDPNVTISEAEYTAQAGETGPRFDLSFAVVMRVKDGLITHLRDYMDALGAAYALDRLPMLVEALERRKARKA